MDMVLQVILVALLMGLMYVIFRGFSNSHPASTRETLSEFAIRLGGRGRSVILAHYPPDGFVQVALLSHNLPDEWQPFVVVIHRREIAFYPKSEAMQQQHSFPRNTIRWVTGELTPASVGERNRFAIHFEKGGCWYVARMDLLSEDTRVVLNSLRKFAPEISPALNSTDAQYGPIESHYAQQDIHGAWTLHESLTLYLLSPLYVLILKDGSIKQRISLDTITHVASVQRMDAAGGVVRFRVAGEDMAYAMDDYEGFAAALAEAAKRSLEAPLEVVERKGKKKKQ